MERDPSKSLLLSRQLLILALTLPGALNFPAFCEVDATMQGKVTKQEPVTGQDSGPKESSAKSDSTPKDTKEPSSKSDKAELEPVKGLNSASINAILEKENKAGDLLKANSTVQGTEVTIQTWTNPKSTDKEKDSKIDSVLLSKKLLDAYPAITGFKYRYFDTSDKNRYMEITVVPGVVESFAAGTLSDKDLLTTLPTIWRAREVENVPTNAESITTVLAGPAQDRRQQALNAILFLEKKGVGAKPFRLLLATVEDAVKAGRNQEMQTNLERLLSALSDQERRLSSAKTVKPTPVKPSQNAAPQLTGVKKETADMLLKGIAINKKKLGDYYPHYGPMYVDRVWIANEIDRRIRAGENMDKYKEPFRQMEDTAVNSKPGLDQSVRYFNVALKIGDREHDDDYKMQQDFADKNKGVDK